MNRQNARVTHESYDPLMKRQDVIMKPLTSMVKYQKHFHEAANALIER